MNKILIHELREKGALLPTGVQEGFELFESHILEGGEVNLRRFLETQIEENGWEESWVDFYYGKLTIEEKAKAESVLTAGQKAWLREQNIGPEDLYFGLDRDLFEITVRLSVTEMLFSTFYFTKKPCTVWCSMEGKAVVFTNKVDKSTSTP